MWLYNKDGYIDLVVSGQNEMDWNNYLWKYWRVNFTESNDFNLPPLYNTSMDSGDLDNDGDIDFVINGQNDDGAWKKYIYKREGMQLVPELGTDNQWNNNSSGESPGIVNGEVRIADYNVDGDLDIVMIGEDLSKVKTNNYIGNSNYDWWENEIQNMQGVSMTIFGDWIYYMGEHSGELRLFRNHCRVVILMI